MSGSYSPAELFDETTIAAKATTECSSCMVYLEEDYCDWQTAWWEVLRPSLKLKQLEFSDCLYPEDRMQDTGMLSYLRLSGEIEILCRERNREVFQDPSSHLPLLPAWHIFNKGTACQQTPLLSICMAGGLFSFSKAKICKASNRQHKQQESHCRHGDTSCHLSINGAFRSRVWHKLGYLLFILSDLTSQGNACWATTRGPLAQPQSQAAVDESD